MVVAAAALVLGAGGSLWWGISGGSDADPVRSHGETPQDGRDAMLQPDAAEARELLAAEDPVDALEGIIRLRSGALSDPSSDLPETYTVEESPALTAERELMDTLHAAQVTYDDPALRMEPLDGAQEGLTQEGPAQEGPGGSEHETHLDVRVTAHDARTDQLDSQDVRLVLHRVDGRWLLYEVQELETQQLESRVLERRVLESRGPEAGRPA